MAASNEEEEWQILCGILFLLQGLPEEGMGGGRPSSRQGSRAGGGIEGGMSKLPTLVLYRTQEEKEANPERLNIDRRNLTVCWRAVFP